MNNQQIGIDLIVSKLLGNITPEQETELNDWMNRSAENKRIYEKLCSGESLLAKKVLYDEIDTNAARRKFLKQIGYQRPIKKYFLQSSKYAAIGIIFLVLSFGIYLASKSSKPVEIYANLNQIATRESQAILILDNGAEVKLDSADNLEDIRVSDSITAINANNRIDYSSVQSKTDSYNTLITLPGKEYSITLSDGTIVHLNSASRLRYPVNFNSDTREVTLDGEGYFIIEKDSRRPFIVHARNIQIRQYGTEFNINTHSSDKIEVVLVEGSVGVIVPNSNQVMMKPFQLAEYEEKGQSLFVKDVDVEPYISWHHGELTFENKNMMEIMNTLSLWYGIDIIIDDKEVETLHFTGKITRYDKIDYILRAMEKTADIKFSMQDNTVHVNKSSK